MTLRKSVVPVKLGHPGAAPITRQDLVFVEFNSRKQGMPSALARPVELPGTMVPARVWTLYHELDPDKRPALPLVPVHNFNAFLEDWMHDWNIDTSGRLRYYSRVIDRPVWLLLEYR